MYNYICTHIRYICSMYIYTVSQKNQPALEMFITSSNVNRFSKLFHKLTRRKIFNKIIIKIVHSIKYFITKHLKSSQKRRFALLFITSYIAIYSEMKLF